MTEPIRVAHIITRLGRGGPQGWTMRCAASAAPARFAVDVICGPGDDPEALNQARLVLGSRLRVIRSLTRRLAPCRDVVALVQITRLLKARDYDVVHTHMTKAGLVGRLAATLAGVPVIVHTEHGLSLHHSRRAAARRCFDLTQRLGARWSDAILVVSAADHHAVIDEVGIPAHLVVDGRQGVDAPAVDEDGLAKVRAREQLGVAPQVALYGTVSRLVPNKRVSDLVTAAAAIAVRRPDARCLIIASGPEEQTLRSLAWHLAVEDRVTFMAGRDDIQAVLPAFDVFVHPSDFEGMPMVVLEAMAAGVPVVAQAAGGTGEVVVDHVSGRLLSIGDVNGIANAVIELLDNPAEAARLAAFGRRLVADQHDGPKRVAAIEALYDELLSAGAPTRRRMRPIRAIRSVRRPAARSRKTLAVVY